MKLLKIILLLIAILGADWIFGKNNVVEDSAHHGKFVQFDIKGKEYEHIYIKLVKNITAEIPKVYHIPGKSTDKFRWTFNIPDSLSRNIWALKFFYISNKEDHGISFTAVINTDTLTATVNNFENNSDTLLMKGVFLKHDSVSHKDILKVDVKEKTFLMDCMKYPGFAFFYAPNNKDKKYEDFVEDYIAKIKENPNSVYYIANLSAAAPQYRSDSDLIKIFNLFSDSLKNSDYGKQIANFISIRSKSKFENIKLPLVNNSAAQEAIIQDFSKYNLIELTASWCGWCHKIIPTLKEISEQYKDRLVITYVTIDKEDGIDNFRSHLVKEHIPWRSLWLINNKNNFLFNKSTLGIPCGILINTKGEIVDCYNFNIPQDLEKFHHVFQVKSKL